MSGSDDEQTVKGGAKRVETDIVINHNDTFHLANTYLRPNQPQHHPSIMFKTALGPLVRRGYATAVAGLNKEVNGFVGAVG